MSDRQWTVYFSDVAIGLGCLVIAAVLFVLVGAQGNPSMMHIHIGHPMLLFVCGMAMLFFAGLLRGTASRGIDPWQRGLAVALGAVAPVLAIAMFVSHSARHPVLWLFAVLAAAVTICGAKARSLWRGMHRTAALAVGLSVLFLVVAVGKSVAYFQAPSGGFQETRRASPDAKLQFLDGPVTSLGAFKGKVVVLDFWGTWCAPCIRALPGLDRIYGKYQSNPKVAFLAVNSELNGDTSDRIRDFVRSSHLQIPVALDRDGATIQSLEINTFPTVLVIDPLGVIRMQGSGDDGPKEMEDRLTREVSLLLQEK